MDYDYQNKPCSCCQKVHVWLSEEEEVRFQKAVCDILSRKFDPIPRIIMRPIAEIRSESGKSPSLLRELWEQIKDWWKE